MKPLVSIVIPVYNGERYIKSAISSVLNQDYQHVELIVLDDGSKDNTLEIIEWYGNRFYWETHPNMGQADTLNKGWQLSNGEILSYLSADDLLKPNAVSTSIDYLQANSNVVLTYCDFDLIDPHSKPIRRVRPPSFNYYDMVVKITCPPGPGVFFHRNAFEAAGLWNSNLKQMPDWDYWLRLGLIGDFCHIPKTLAAFRVHDDSLSFAKGDSQKSNEPVAIISDYFERTDLPENIIAAKEEALSNAYLTSAQLHWRAGRIRVAAAYIVRAMSLFPRNFQSIKTFRLIFNALFNRIGHRLLWTLKKFPLKKHLSL